MIVVLIGVLVVIVTAFFCLFRFVKPKTFLKIVLLFMGAIILIPVFFAICLYYSADMAMPEIIVLKDDYKVVNKEDTLYCNDSYLLEREKGIYELVINGSNQERGAKQGALTKDLMKYQEDVFMDQIRVFVPSEKYLSFLRFMLVVFNRNLGEYVPLEYRNEIAAMSLFCTNDYNAIGNPYERQLNYHGAHDIGHAMQQYMLVGCSSFAAWGDNTQDGELIVGRNFDFYMNEGFAENKIITFAAPNKGYKYVSVGWAGMMGVLSGMNEKGLTVTINAAKGAIPTSSATPISILTREILQYAANIDEAYIIAEKHKTFVSESILISSSIDGKAAIIEKTPKEMALYTVNATPVICTNHFQSEHFMTDDYNVENIATSDSKYRYDRMQELLNEHSPIDYQHAAQILRNRYGKNGEDIGIGNEMTINQSIAHHSVIFKPKSNCIWISTNPWQSGHYLGYNLTNFFKNGEKPHVFDSLCIAADTLFLERDYPRLLKYRAGIKTIKTAIAEEQELTPAFIEEFKAINPNHYYTYQILGDYYSENQYKALAVAEYKNALKCEIPYTSDRKYLEKKCQ